MNRRAALYLILVFVLGVALGVLGNQLADKWNFFQRERRGYAPPRRGPVEGLTRELALSPEQQRQLETILDETGKQYDQIRQRMRMREEYERVRQQSQERIRAILTEEQRAKFEELLRRIEGERRRRSRGRNQSPPSATEKKK